jgi:predicted NAD/FAD-dependent oxidoreductase
VSNAVLIVGAGISGLSCARSLSTAGAAVRLLEKSRGVGGRCATRRIEGRPVDHGLSFFHGSAPAFLTALREVDAGVLPGWPARVRGRGRPCQPLSFRPGEQRLAYRDGLTVFPKHLARGIPIELGTRVESLRDAGSRLVAATDRGDGVEASTVVLALPAPQSVALLETLEPTGSAELRAARKLLGGIASVRCLTLIAGYADDRPAPEWDLCYPEDSRVVHLVSHDTTKRAAGASTVLVLQAHAPWSRAHWDHAEDAWAASMLADARTVCGSWVTEPEWTRSQRWRYARQAGHDTLTNPLLIELEGGARIGLIGEALAPAGGVQGAWQSGRKMADRLLAEPA